MTSSKFAGKSTIKLPAVCHKSLIGLKPDYATGEPNHLTALATWKQLNFGYDLAESFPLHAGPGPGAWTGWSDQVGLNLAASVHQMGPTDYFTFVLYIRMDTGTINSVDWDDVLLAPRPPFDSGLLASHYLPPYPDTTLHVVD